MGLLAAAYRNRFPRLRVAAITGSSGKTTTRELLTTVLAAQGGVLSTQGNLNNDLGLPLTLARLSAEHKTAVLELGMSAAGEIRRLARMARPKVGIITNIGDAHMGHFRNRRAVAKAKCELLAELPPEGTAVLNADDPLLAQAVAGCRRLTFGMATHADVRIMEVYPDWNGTRVILRYKDRSRPVPLKILGSHQAWNAAAAVAAGIAMGVSFEAACLALGHHRPQAAMRMQMLKLGPHRLINDAYNSNPQSAAAALQLLSQLPKHGRTFFIAGSMLELGPISGEAHRVLGANAAAAGVNGLVAVGKEARTIAQAARQAGVAWVMSLEAAGQAAKVLLPKLSAKGDIILVKGSRAVGLEACVEDLRKAFKK
jgi:UDP-N-acetylmuramoyl-tripeptide--D-alanyl-D-alanine ligase